MSAEVTRRAALSIAGTTGAAFLLSRPVAGPAAGTEEAEAATASCVLTPAKTEGPYFVDEKLNRSDIRAGEDGVTLALTIQVVDADRDCAPVTGATVDIWHANAGGLYSGESQNGTVGKTYLRGYQVTGSDGKASFTTVFPGWYRGRAIHIPFKVRLYDGSSKTFEFTSQLFFDPGVENQILVTSAYSSRGTPDTANASDNIYGSDGSDLLVPLTASGGGYAGTFVAGLSDVPGTTSTTNVVGGSLGSAKVRKASSGKRVLDVELELGETVTAEAVLSRSGRTLASRTKKLKSGTRTLAVSIPSKVAKGSARLTLTLTDAAGATKTKRRTVSVPRL
jgi:protocatechuate 3,4-dioxygenase beta subunit